MSWLTPLSTLGAALLVLRWRRRRRHQRAVERDLDFANGVEALSAASQPSPALAHVVQQAHTLRLILETPLRRICTPLFSDSPWRRRERCDEYDRVLADVRRAMWEWLREVEGLSESDRLVLAELGLSLGFFRSFLFARIDRTDDPWEQVVWRRAPDVERVHREVLQTILELRRFEQALTTMTAGPYRMAG